MLTWALGFWLLIPFNLVILLSVACFPPFATWYTARYRFHQMQTHERLQARIYMCDVCSMCDVCNVCSIWNVCHACNACNACNVCNVCHVQAGLAFIPFFKYATSAVGEIAVAIIFTQFKMMPFRAPDGTPVYGMESVWNNRCSRVPRLPTPPLYPLHPL